MVLLAEVVVSTCTVVACMELLDLSLGVSLILGLLMAVFLEVKQSFSNIKEN